MAKKKKFYAVKEGKNVQNKIVESWDECKKLVHGYNAVYKSFPTIEEAHKYLGEVNVQKVKEQTKFQREKKKKVKETTKHIKGFRVTNEMYEDLENKCSTVGIKMEDAIKFALTRYLY